MPRTGTTSEATRTTERLSVNVTLHTARVLRDLADARSSTVTEVIRRAVELLKLLEDEWDAGTEVRLVNKSGEVERLRVL